MTISIRLEKEVYYAGECVVGKVEMEKKEAIKINNNVTIRLQGFAEVYGNYGIMARKQYLNTSAVLVLKSWKEAVYSGNFGLPFHFDLPSNLPSTYSHPSGKIIYYFDLIYDDVAEIKPKIEKQFIVLNKIDLNERMDLNKPFCQSGQIKSTTAPFEYSITTNRSAYVSGDFMKIQATIINKSDMDIDSFPICLIETVTMWSKKGPMEVSRVVARANFPNRVKKRSTSEIESGKQLKLRVPALWPSSNNKCDILEVAYCLAIVKATELQGNKTFEKPITIGSNAYDKMFQIPILIGTVPYKEDMTSPPSYHDVDGESNNGSDDLPQYDDFVQTSSPLVEQVFELDSRRITLPGNVPELSKPRLSLGNLFGNLGTLFA